MDDLMSVVASLPGLSSPSYSGGQFIKLLQRADAPEVEDIASCGGALHRSWLFGENIGECNPLQPLLWSLSWLELPLPGILRV